MLKRCYAGAEVILEYGCGGTTVLGARMPGKLILSVESDGERARATDTYLDFADLPSAASIHRVDLAGGDGQMRYARGIWDEPFFRHPDLVLINGRFRSACLAAVCTGIRRRVSVLISDHERLAAFVQRPDLLRPVKQVGRLALFDLQPGMFEGAALAAVLDAAGEELTV